jgi:uncharacterized protein (DUF924 family)
VQCIGATACADVLLPARLETMARRGSGYDASAMQADAKRTANAAPAELIRFWHEAGRTRWFGKDARFDAEFRERFLDLHYAAARRALAAGHVDALEPKELRVFLCLPFMHSEDLADLEAGGFAG